MAKRLADLGSPEHVGTCIDLFACQAPGRVALWLKLTLKLFFGWEMKTRHEKNVKNPTSNYERKVNRELFRF